MCSFGRSFNKQIRVERGFSKWKSEICNPDSSSYNLDFSNLDNFLAKEGRVCPTFDAKRKVCRLIGKLVSYRSSGTALYRDPVLLLAYLIFHFSLLL